MTITAIAARGTGLGNSSTSVTSFSPNATCAVGRSLILTCATDNNASGSLATATGATNLHSTVTDNTGGNTWTKLGEYNHSPTGVVFDGLTVSLWLCNVGTQILTTNDITLTTVGSPSDKALSLYEFSSTLGFLTKVGSPDYQIVVGANDFGSSSLSGFSSAARLWFRGMGKEANTVTALTVTAGFTAITNLRSRNNAAAMTAYGEFIIATATGETSNPSLAVAGDTASVFVALVEGVPSSGARPQVCVCT